MIFDYLTQLINSQRLIRFNEFGQASTTSHWHGIQIHVTVKVAFDCFPSSVVNNTDILQFVLCSELKPAGIFKVLCLSSLRASLSLLAKQSFFVLWDFAEFHLKDHTQTRCPFISFCWNPSPATRGTATGHVRLSYFLLYLSLSMPWGSGSKHPPAEKFQSQHILLFVLGMCDLLY